jgi:hypothetical protein
MSKTFDDYLVQFRLLGEVANTASALRQSVAGRIGAGEAINSIDAAIIAVLDSIRSGFLAAEQSLERLRQLIAKASPDDAQVNSELIGATSISKTGLQYMPPKDPKAGGTNLYLHRPFPTFRSTLRRQFNRDDQSGTQPLTVQFAA